MGSSSQILHGPRGVLAQLARSTKWPIRLTKQFACQDRYIGLAGTNNVIRLDRVRDHANCTG